MSYWAAAQLQPNRTSLALHCLTLAGYEVYHPRLRVHRRSYGRRNPSRTAIIFPGTALSPSSFNGTPPRWTPGVVRVVLDGAQPARVPDAVIARSGRASVTAWSSFQSAKCFTWATRCASCKARNTYAAT